MNSLPWFKVYTEARNDAKLRSLSDAEHRVWFHLLCFAAEQEERGTIKDYDEELLALEVCNADVALLGVTLQKLARFRIIEITKGGVTFCAFNRRQQPKPSDSKERVKSRVAKHRAMKRQENVTPVTPSVTPGNAMKRPDREEEREEDISISGKVILNDAVVEGASAPTAAASGWTDTEAQRVARRLAGRLKILNPDIDGMVAVLQQQPHAVPYIEAEAAKCIEWYSAKGRKVTLRLFDNWLGKAKSRQETERLQQQASNGKVDLNGSQQHQPTEQQPVQPNEHDLIHAYHQRQATEAAAARAKMVS